MMNAGKKINLEWIPNAYSAKEEDSPFKKAAATNRDSKNLIVKSTGLSKQVLKQSGVMTKEPMYLNKKSRC
jgi:hypothetical protein